MKGYWIVRVDVSDPAVYATYMAANPPIFAKFGARFLVRGGPFEAPEGTSRARNVVIEFPDYAAALACYRSPEYQENTKRRTASAVADIVIIEGYDAPPAAASSSATRYALVPVATPEEWSTYHAIRLAELFEAHGNGGLYEPDHPDEHRPDHFPLLLKLDGRPVGATRVDLLAPGVAGFRGVAIARSEQRRGYGRILNAESEAFARARGVRKIVLNAHPTAIGYWERLGFVRESFNPAELVGAAAVCIQMAKYLT